MSAAGQVISSSLVRHQKTRAHVGLQGAFVIADFEEAPPVAFLATATEGQTVEDASAVARVTLTFDSLRTEALHSKASRELIMMTAEDQWTT